MITIKYSLRARIVIKILKEFRDAIFKPLYFRYNYRYTNVINGYNNDNKIS
jgi:hypothetical protein